MPYTKNRQLFYKKTTKLCEIGDTPIMSKAEVTVLRADNTNGVRIISSLMHNIGCARDRLTIHCLNSCASTIQDNQPNSTQHTSCIWTTFPCKTLQHPHSLFGAFPTLWPSAKPSPACPKRCCTHCNKVKEVCAKTHPQGPSLVASFKRLSFTFQCPPPHASPLDLSLDPCFFKI